MFFTAPRPPPPGQVLGVAVRASSAGSRAAGRREHLLDHAASNPVPVMPAVSSSESPPVTPPDVGAGTHG